MKNLYVLILLFIVNVNCFSQDENVLSDGYKIFKYPNGTVSSEGLIKNGKPEGFWKSYYVTGVKKSEGKRTNFLLDSLWLFYDQTGDTTEKISYLYGKKSGWYYKYKRDNSVGLYIWSKELYAGDKKESTAYMYFPDGKIQQTILYKNGKKEGLSKEFDKNGTVISLLEYNNDFLISREKINRTDNKGIKQGDWKDFYPDGTIKNERTYKNDLLHGYYKEYDNKGKLIMTMLYEDGAIVKSKVEDEPDIKIENKYNNNGKIIYSGPYKNDVPVGVHREYNEEGKVINSYVYNDNGLKASEGIVDEEGNRNGKWKDFYADGKIMDEGQYSSNRRTGQWKFYSQTGKTEQTGGYNNGRPDGSWKWFYDNGNILREEQYFQGNRDGVFVEYSENGDVLSQGEYTDGEKNGKWINKTAGILEEGEYITGLKEGTWKIFYIDGKLKFKGNFVQDNPDGQHVFYYENGKIKEDQYYKNGIRIKTWKKFNEEGLPLIIITYKDDVETSINGVRIKLPEVETKLIK
jgi:uncharacterized protein